MLLCVFVVIDVCAIQDLYKIPWRTYICIYTHAYVCALHTLYTHIYIYTCLPVYVMHAGRGCSNERIYVYVYTETGVCSSAQTPFPSIRLLLGRVTYCGRIVGCPFAYGLGNRYFIVWLAWLHGFWFYMLVKPYLADQLFIHDSMATCLLIAGSVVVVCVLLVVRPQCVGLS